MISLHTETLITLRDSSCAGASAILTLAALREFDESYTGQQAEADVQVAVIKAISIQVQPET